LFLGDTEQITVQNASLTAIWITRESLPTVLVIWPKVEEPKVATG
jgi:hypothetical protein